MPVSADSVVATAVQNPVRLTEESCLPGNLAETEKQCLKEEVKEEEEGLDLERRRREWEKREKVMAVVEAILWMTNMMLGKSLIFV